MNARRAEQEMPPDIERILEDRGVMPDYQARPYYQRNDYLAWIKRAKLEETRQRRIGQMIAELEVGGLYMRMVHKPSRKS